MRGVGHKRGKYYNRRVKPIGECGICSESSYSYHHIIPKSQGGTDEEVNKVLLCERCHAIAEGMADKGEYLSPRAMDIIRLTIAEKPVEYTA